MVAFGLLEAAKGWVESAREWLTSVLMFDPRVVPPQAGRRRGVARHRRRGRGTGAGEGDPDNPKWRAARTLTLPGAPRARLRRAPPTNAGLWLRGALAPRRLWTRSSCAGGRGTSGSGPGAKPRPRFAPSRSTDGTRPRFLTLARKARSTPDRQHRGGGRARLGSGAGRGRLLGSSYARPWWGRRADAAVEEVRQLVEQALGPMLRRSQRRVGELPSLIESAAQSTQGRAYSQLEVADEPPGRAQARGQGVAAARGSGPRRRAALAPIGRRASRDRGRLVAGALRHPRQVW